MLTRFALLAALGLSFARAEAQQQFPVNCLQPAADGGCTLNDISIIQLLANPAKYDGKRVRVTGYVHFEFEGNGIYLHKEDYEHHMFKNGLWLSSSGTSTKDCQDTYALIEGTYHAENTGHMGMWSGSIMEITTCLKLP